jgi:SET domain-containing protein 6
MIVPLISKNSHLFPPPVGVTSFDSSEARETLLALAHRMGSLIMAYAFDIERGEDDEAHDEDEFVTDDEEELPKAMVPLADLLNADGQRNNVS